MENPRRLRYWRWTALLIFLWTLGVWASLSAITRREYAKTKDLAIAAADIREIRIRHGIIWISGVCVLVFVSIVVEKSGRKTEAAVRILQEREKSLAEAQRQTHVGSFEYDFKKGRLKWSEEMFRICGVEKKDFLGTQQDFLRRIHPEDFPKVESLREKSLASQESPLEVEFRIIRPNGEVRFIRMLFETFRDEKGNPVRRSGTFQDITDRKVSEARYAAVLDTTIEGFALIDMTGRIIDCNRTFCTMTGFEREELLAKKIYEVLADESPAVVQEHILSIIHKGADRFETRHVRKDGTFFSAEISVAYLSHEGGRIVGFVRDITERKSAEEALIQSESSLRQAQEVASLGHYSFDIPAGTWTCSPALDRVFGIEAGYAKTTEGWLEIVHPDYRGEMGVYLKQHVMGEGQPFDKEYQIIRRNDGAVRWVYGKGELKLSPGGVPVSMFGIIQDITSKKEAQEKTKLLEGQLQQAQKMEAVGRLAGGIAHDFNNLLTGINGYTEILLSALKDGDPLQPDLMEIKKAADRAASLTSQLLAFSRRQVISPKLIDLNTLISDSTRMLQRLIGEDVELDFIPAADLGAVKVDPHQIEQVLVNLAINARDAMPEGGKLTFETANAEIDADFSRTHIDARPGRYVLLAVTDSGIGMSEEIKEHLFEPFFTTKGKDKGTGLGLSTIYGIVRQNGGFISVYSEVGAGTSFKVYLPFAAGVAEPVGKPKPGTLPKGAETILLIEDEPMVRNLTRKILEKQGYKVLTADHGSKALELARDHSINIDLLLTDVIMPEMNGRQLYEIIRTLRPGLRVLYMSGYPENAIAHHGVLQEGTHFIQKPFSLENLVHTVRKILDA